MNRFLVFSLLLAVSTAMLVGCQGGAETKKEPEAKAPAGETAPK